MNEKRFTPSSSHGFLQHGLRLGPLIEREDIADTFSDVNRACETWLRANDPDYDPIAFSIEVRAAIEASSGWSPSAIFSPSPAPSAPRHSSLPCKL